MGNMGIWNALKTPPKEALKPIQGGRLRGKTDINPQWRYKAMTEHFGACGVGWKYTIEKLWLEPVGPEVCAFAQVSVSIKVDSEWSDPIPGIGGSMLLEQETKGLHVSDEAYKMATTDALSVALKMLGVAADIYSGFFDGSKFSKPPASKTAKAAPAETTDAIHAEQIVKLEKIAKKKGANIGELVKAKGWPATKPSELSFDQAQVLIDDLAG